jgi:hypothetical protein
VIEKPKAPPRLKSSLTPHSKALHAAARPNSIKSQHRGTVRDLTPVGSILGATFNRHLRYRRPTDRVACAARVGPAPRQSRAVGRRLSDAGRPRLKLGFSCR